MFKKTWKGWKLLAIAWLLFISILFFLPGSALPKESWLDAVYFDKWVHFGFFAVLLFLWRFFFPLVKYYTYLLMIVAMVYGFGVELIQHYCIPNRSFDLEDVVADMIGASVGIWFWSRHIKK